MSDLIFADVSEFQKVINWPAYGAAVPAVIVRLHNGYRADYYAAANLAGARANCRWRAWYQYLPADVDPAAAARAFMAMVQPLPGEVMIVDLEAGTGDQRARLAAWHAALSGAPEWTYSGSYFARTSLPGVSLDWIASYTYSGQPDASFEPTLPPHKLWQFSAGYKFPGITQNVADANIFHGTVDDLILMTGAIQVSLGGDVPLTPQDAALVAAAVWQYAMNGGADGKQTVTTGNMVLNTYQGIYYGGPSTGNASLASQIAKAANPAPAAPVTIDTAALAKAVAAAVVAALPKTTTGAVVASAGLSAADVQAVASAAATEVAKRMAS